MIPDYIYEVVSLVRASEEKLLTSYESFKYLRFQTLSRQTHKAFFFAVILLLGQGMAIRICENIMSRFKIPKNEAMRYKHEHCIHYLNTLDTDRADKVLLMTLIELEDNIENIRQIAKCLSMKVKQEQRKGFFGYI